MPDYDDGSKTENTRSAYPLDFIPNASRTGRAGHPEEHHLPDRRRLWRDAADRQAVADAGDVPLPLRLHRQGRRHREGADRRAAGILHLLRRAVPAAPSVRLCRPAARLHQQAQGRLLAGQFRLDRRQIRRRPPHADQGDAHAADRRAQRLAERRRLPHRSLFRLLGADLGARRRAASAQSVQDLEGQGRVRQDRAPAGRHVPEELHQVREPRHRRHQGGGAGSAHRGGVISGCHHPPPPARGRAPGGDPVTPALQYSNSGEDWMPRLRGA